jgi:hypothetical protein
MSTPIPFVLLRPTKYVSPATIEISDPKVTPRMPAPLAKVPDASSVPPASGSPDQNESVTVCEPVSPVEKSDVMPLS